MPKVLSISLDFLTVCSLLIYDNPGIAKVENMGRNDQNNSKRQQNQLIIMPILLGKQKKDANRKKKKWDRTMMMHPESMAKRHDTNEECQPDHTGFKPEIVNDIDPE